MTTDALSLEFEWIPREYGSILERSTLAEIEITAGGACLTEIEDLKARTIRTKARLSAYDLARWLAGNWWRLCCEPEKEGVDWQLSHNTAGIGGGYVWPNIDFASDGDRIHVQATPASLEKHSIRYLTEYSHSITVTEFEREIATFIEAVSEAVKHGGAEDTELSHLWNEVQKERSHPELTSRRKMEALLGFDPAEAPPELLDALLQASRRYGVEAVYEIAAVAGEGSLSLLETLWNAIKAQAVTIRVPEGRTLRSSIRKTMHSTLLPWQKAEHAARLARDSWSVSSGPVSNARLADIFQIGEEFILTGEDRSEVPVHAGFRNSSGLDEFKVFLSKRPVASRRFALARLIADHLAACEEDQLLPATRLSTQRQKFQRAFAQEFLCPYTELKAYLGSGRLDDESMEDAASYFEVSPLLIRTTLVNKGMLERSVLPEVF